MLAEDCLISIACGSFFAPVFESRQLFVQFLMSLESLTTCKNGRHAHELPVSNSPVGTAVSFSAAFSLVLDFDRVFSFRLLVLLGALILVFSCSSSIFLIRPRICTTFGWSSKLVSRLRSWKYVPEEDLILFLDFLNFDNNEPHIGTPKTILHAS